MSRVALAALGIALVGCGDANGPEPYAAMSFNFHGSVPGSPSGSFNVAGRRDPYATNYPTGAIGNVFGDTFTGEIIRIVGSRSGARAELEFELVKVAAPGLLRACSDAAPSPDNCILNGDFVPVIPSSPYYLRNGDFTVTVAEITRKRIRGTFQGISIGQCFGCGDQYRNVPDTMTISNGAFDLPYR